MINIYNKKWVLRVVPGNHPFEGIAIFPFVIYSHSKEEIPKQLRMHEEYHIEHQLRWGVLPWFVAYWLLLIVYGYNKHPFEVAARKASGEMNE
jgi:hypothetical protein